MAQDDATSYDRAQFCSIERTAALKRPAGATQFDTGERIEENAEENRIIGNIFGGQSESRQSELQDDAGTQF